MKNPTFDKGTCKSLRTKRRGFGLVETLTAVAILGILTAISAPILAKTTDQMDEKRSLRIAQEYAQLAANASAAGATEIAEAETVDQALQALGVGITGSGVFEETQFRLPNVGDAEKAGASLHLEMRGGMLIYHPNIGA